jgi:non-ribosomal peptide synthetase component F
LHNEKLPDESLQYADLSEWQNELFEGEDAEIGKEYWSKKKKQLSSFVDWKLNCELQPKFNPEFQPEHITLGLNSDIAAKLEALADKYDTSVSVLLQACWQILLWRLTGKSDIVIGTYYDGRNYEELKSALGLFAKYLPIYCYLEANFKFSEILKQTSESTDEAFKWQESFTWEQITDSKENIQSSSFFSVCFQYQEQPAKYSAADVSFSIYKQYVCFDQFKVKLSCVRRDDALVTEFHYNSNLFEVADIERLAGQFQTLLESVTDKPEVAIGELEILSDHQRHQLLVEFNQTQIDYPKHQCVHQLFEQQVKQAPNDIALVFENQQLSYAELNARANCLAHYLRQRGVKPDNRIPWHPHSWRSISTTRPEFAQREFSLPATGCAGIRPADPKASGSSASREYRTGSMHRF